VSCGANHNRREEAALPRRNVHIARILAHAVARKTGKAPPGGKTRSRSSLRAAATARKTAQATARSTARRTAQATVRRHAQARARVRANARAARQVARTRAVIAARHNIRHQRVECHVKQRQAAPRLSRPIRPPHTHQYHRRY
jgi:hypothetical protein